MWDWFLVYAYFSAGIMIIDVYHTLYHSENSDKYLMDVELIADSLEVSTSWILALLYLLVAWFGWLLLPVKIIEKIMKLFER